MILFTNTLRAASVAVLLTTVLVAQTSVDLRSQSRNVDFSAAAATKPFKTGVVIPAVCNAGDTFFKTDAPAGQNLYACTATNIWTAMTGVNSNNSGPGAAEVLKNQIGGVVTARQLLTGEGTLVTQQTDTVTVEADTAVTPRYATAAVAPTGTCQTGRDTYTRVSGFPHFYGCVDGAWKAVYAVSTAAPATCVVGELYFNSSDLGLYGCTGSNTWSKFNKSGVDMSQVGECIITYSCSVVSPGQRAALPAAAVNNNVAAIRVVVPNTIRLKRAMMYATGGTSTGAFVAGIYSDDNGLPGSLLPGTELRFVDLAAASFRVTTWGTGDVVLPPNVYWVGFSSQDVAAQYHLYGGAFATYGGMLAALTGSPGIVSCANDATGTGATYSLPASCGTASAVTGFDPPLILATAQ